MEELSTLKKGDSSNLALVHPSEREKAIQFNLNGAEWQGALSRSAYLRREEILAQQSLTRNDGLTYWILVDSSRSVDPSHVDSGIRLPLASCETFRKNAFLAENGSVQDVICHGIASVFCAPHLRKRGYARRMMQELGRVLETHQVDGNTRCLFSVLYSDIGKEFYSNLGWESFNSCHISLPAGTLADTADLPATRPLYTEDLAALCELDVAYVRRDLESRPTGTKPAVALLPDLQTMQWHHAREDFVGAELHGKAPKIRGAIVRTDAGERVWCYWTRAWYNPDPTDTKGNTLYILRLVIEGAGVEQANSRHMNENPQYHTAVATLLAMAQREAAEWNMERVEIWAPIPTVLAAAKILDPDVEVVERDTESIASLRWFPEHKGTVADNIEWIGNEKYGWC